jgi:hypothetical protein
VIEAPSSACASAGEACCRRSSGITTTVRALRTEVTEQGGDLMDDRKGQDARGEDDAFDGDVVDVETAHQQVLLEVRRSASSGVDDFDGWGEAEVDPDPIRIDDLDGRPLFYDFEVGDGLGVVRASANTLVGNPVVFVQLGPHRWAAGDAMERAAKAGGEHFESGEARATSLVCYAYPKIGVRVEGTDREGRTRARIVDVADLRPVDRFGDDALEGQTSYSFLDHVRDQAPARLRRHRLAMRELDLWREAAPEVVEGGPLSEVSPVQSLALSKAYLAYIPWYSWHTVRFAPRCDRPEVFQLYAQQTSVYCAVATGQMILDFYKYHFDQDDIATAMGTGTGGTGNSGQVAGYESLSNHGLEATYDGSAAWSEARAEIDANRPVKSGIPGHARAVAGWKRQNVFLAGTAPQRWLKVFDPWPWNADICDGGAVYWEDWDSVTHTNWIRVQHA